MILTAMVAVPCAWLGHKIEQKRTELEAVKVVEGLGGWVEWDYQIMERGGRDAEPFGPRWLRNILGDNFFSEVEGVSFSNSNSVKDADLAILAKFPSLKGVDLQVGEDAHITDAGLAQLRQLPLRGLAIASDVITDAGLVNVKGLTQLQDLRLYVSNMTDAGLENLRGLTQLETLNLCRRNVSDKAVEDLQRALPNCKIDR